ncbi:GntR family transcriptional regulator [Intestinimonas sp. MSJ-38]|uniref:GntR family transcriptional regulator n=1 Tax=Intestinimonas sp. MSJ-38 TaxID=2841532 RepID=UPI001C127B84|nr:GntR family transcriptional regulator [Intestinimonas sp. MSJ-38]MBU5431832.1 GntR family transcriptional regulator [Intestinimonas sp. MSJ-38]
MITIDYKDRRPIYEQIVSSIEDLAVRGVLESDSQLPSVRQLAVELSINPNTIQRAYSQLEKTGVIYSVKGKGNFVAADPKRLREEKMEQILQEMEKLLRQALALGVGRERMENWLHSLLEKEEGGNKA